MCVDIPEDIAAENDPGLLAFRLLCMLGACEECGEINGVGP